MSASAKRSYRPETQLVHAGILRSQFGETSEALFLTQGYVYESALSAEKRFKNEEPGYQYTRFSNPTVTMFEQRMTARHDLLFELEIGDAVDEQAADPVVAVIDVDGVALATELLGGGEAGRAGTDDADGVRPLAQRQRRLHPAPCGSRRRDSRARRRRS